jgi:hypothetical protein
VLLALLFGCCAIATGRSVEIRFGERVLTVSGLDWGWSGRMGWNTFAPVRLSIAPMPEAFAGAVRLSYPQDNAQNASILVPFATTPGRETVVELTAAIPSPYAELKLEIVSDRGQVRDVPLDDFVLGVGTVNASSDMASIGRPGFPPSRSMILLIGKQLSALHACSEAMIAAGEMQPLQGPTPTTTIDPRAGVDPWQNALPVRADPADLPAGWLSYQSIACVVAEERELLSAPPAALESLRAWLASGGRLVLQLDPGSTRWQEFLPERWPRGIVEVEPLAAHAGQSLALADDAAESDGLASSISARAMRVTREGAAFGWRVHLPVRGSEGGDSRGLAASGPCGLGVLMLAGVDPERLAPTIDHAVSRGRWRALLEAVMPPRFMYATASDMNMNNYGYSDTFGSGPLQSVHEAMRAVTTVPELSNWYFYGIALLLLAIIGVVGPLGRWALAKRGMASRSWLYSLATVGLASCLALALPYVVRSGADYHGTAEIIDAVFDRQRRLLAGSGTGVRTFFAGRGGEMPVETSGDGVWWRGVSASSSFWYGGGKKISRREFPTLFAPAALGSLRAAEAGGVAAGQWQFRAACFESPRIDAERLPRVEAIEFAGDQILLRLSNLEAGAIINEIDVHARRPDGESGSIRGTQGGMIPADADGSVAVTLAGVPVDEAREETGCPFTRLGLAYDRWAAMSRLAERGRWTLVRVRVTNEGRAGSSSKNRTVRCYRMLVPDPARAATGRGATP